MTRSLAFILLFATFAVACTREQPPEPVRSDYQYDVVLRPWQVAQIAEEQGLTVGAVQANLAEPVDVIVELEPSPGQDAVTATGAVLIPRNVEVCTVELSTPLTTFDNEETRDRVEANVEEHLEWMVEDFEQRCEAEGEQATLDVAAVSQVIDENQPRNETMLLLIADQPVGIQVAESLEAAARLPEPGDEEKAEPFLSKPVRVCNTLVGPVSSDRRFTSEYERQLDSSEAASAVLVEALREECGG